MSRTLPHTHNVLGVTIHYTGHPKRNRWYENRSKHQGRHSGGISNGDFQAALGVHGPQRVHRVETMVCAVASHLARPEDEIISETQGLVKAIPVPRKAVVNDQD